MNARGKKLLVINKRQQRQQPQRLDLAGVGRSTSISYTAPSTGDNAVATAKLTNNLLQLEPFEVAVVSVE